MNDLTEQQRQNIERNKREGLLCACNAVLVPYYDAHGQEHGTLTREGVTHGYDDCGPAACLWCGTPATSTRTGWLIRGDGAALCYECQTDPSHQFRPKVAT
jgi:predicted CXXCH cytochrome family protein